MVTTTAAAGAPGVSPAHYAHALDPGLGHDHQDGGDAAHPAQAGHRADGRHDGEHVRQHRERTNAGAILSQVQSAQPDAQFAVAEYKDDESSSPFAYRVDQQLTANPAAVTTGINAWSAGAAATSRRRGSVRSARSRPRSTSDPTAPACS